MNDMNEFKKICDEFIEHKVSHEYWVFNLIRLLITSSRTVSIKIAQAITYTVSYTPGDGS